MFEILCPVLYVILVKKLEQTLHIYFQLIPYLFHHKTILPKYQMSYIIRSKDVSLYNIAFYNKKALAISYECSQIDVFSFIPIRCKEMNIFHQTS